MRMAGRGRKPPCVGLRTLVFACLLTATVVLSVIPITSGYAVGVPTPAASRAAGAARATIDFQLPGSVRAASTHSLVVTAANVTSLQGDPVQFSVAVPSGVTAISIVWQFGDGSTSTTSSSSITHTFLDPGRYLIYVNVSTSTGVYYDNLQSLLYFAVQASFVSDSAGTLALPDGAIQGNTTSNLNAEADIAPAGSVLVADWIDDGPSNPYWNETLPSYALSGSAKAAGATLSTPVVSIGGIDGVGVSFPAGAATGSYYLMFNETTTQVYGGSASETSTFEFTVFVGTGLGVVAPSIPVSPHKGVLNFYLPDPNTGQVLTDPAVSYISSEADLDMNIYQTLVTYNGSQTGPDPSDFVPDLAMCVPGPGCQKMYQTSLVSSSGDWTFVINPNATFYNSTTGAHYPVFPNDVAFSIARACLVTDNTWQFHGSWVLCQALLPNSTANAAWDGGLHYPLNNTPSNILASMTVNESGICTGAMQNGLSGNGCITFHTSLSGAAWPEMLELLASPYGGSVVSCRWATNVGYGLPGWETGSSCNSAPPSTPPGPTAWDRQDIIVGGFFHGEADLNVSSPMEQHAVGSGPYYLTTLDHGQIAQLTANPFWANTSCFGGVREGCLPPAPTGGTPAYIPTVNVYVNASSYDQAKAAINGTGDISGFNDSLAPSFLADQFRAGTLQFLDTPNGEINLFGARMVVNLTKAQSLTKTSLRFPSTLMEDLNLRQFLVRSFPTQTLQQSCIVDGVENCFQSGGAIPAYMFPYYPHNISWFYGTPDTNPLDVGGAAWWWNQTSLDSLAGATCTVANPCTFPLMDVVSPATSGYNYGTSTEVPSIDAWVSSIRSISQGAINPVVVTAINSTDWIDWGFSNNSGAPLWYTGWIPDYFDPTDYVAPFYLQSSFYGSYDNLTALVRNASLDQPCSGPAPNPSITNSCQGSALAEMNKLLVEAASCSLPGCSGDQRTLLYNMAENIANELGLYTNAAQDTVAFSVAPWIDATTISRSPFSISVGLPLFDVAYRGSLPSGYPLLVSSVADPPVGHPSAARSSVEVGRTSVHPGASNLTIEAGQTVVFSVTATGGTGRYSFTWIGLPPGCSSDNSPFLECSPTAGANTTISVNVTDSSSHRAFANGLTLTVVPRLEVSALTISPSNLTLGGSLAVSLAWSGGIPPFTVGYVGLPPGCPPANSSALTCTPSSIGNYAIVAEISDRVGVSALGTASVEVTSIQHNQTNPHTPPPATTTSSPKGWSTTQFVEGLVGAGAAGFLIGAVIMYRLRGQRPRRDDPPSEPGSSP